MLNPILKTHNSIIQGGEGEWNSILKAHNAIIHMREVRSPIKLPIVPIVGDFRKKLCPISLSLHYLWRLNFELPSFLINLDSSLSLFFHIHKESFFLPFSFWVHSFLDKIIHPVCRCSPSLDSWSPS